MTYHKMPVSKALKMIDEELIKKGTFERIDIPTRSKTQFFKICSNGKQFAVIVGDLDKETSEFRLQQTQILLEEFPPKIECIVPNQDFHDDSAVNRKFSHLVPPNQFPVLIGSEKALQQLLDWYTGTFEKESTTAINKIDLALSTRGEVLSKTRNTLTEQSEISIDTNAQDNLSNDTKNLSTDEREAVVKVRFGQGSFRDALIGIVGAKCWMSGIEGKQLLVASHIRPWSHCKEDTDSRGNSNNGLLLSSLWDSAFDTGLISFDVYWQVICSTELSKSAKQALNLDQYIELPEKFRNDGRGKFFEYHRAVVFERWKKDASRKEGNQ